MLFQVISMSKHSTTWSSRADTGLACRRGDLQPAHTLAEMRPTCPTFAKTDLKCTRTKPNEPTRYFRWRWVRFANPHVERRGHLQEPGLASPSPRGRGGPRGRGPRAAKFGFSWLFSPPPNPPNSARAWAPKTALLLFCDESPPSKKSVGSFCKITLSPFPCRAHRPVLTPPPSHATILPYPARRLM